MEQLLRRLWRTLGWKGAVGLVVAGLFLLIIAEGDFHDVTGSFRTLSLLAAGLVLSGWYWGVYTRPQETSHYQRVLGPLLASREEFCLVLRPFGSDGEVLVPHIAVGKPRHRWLSVTGLVTPRLTLEQVVAAAARRHLGVRAFAMVDQNLELAPPGPVYLRAPHTQWKQPAGELIRRAHTIAILLPPRQDLRAALEWELKEIIRCRRQSKVVIVLPPCDGWRYDYPTARRQACVLLAALEGLPSGIGDVPVSRVNRHLAEMPERALVGKVNRNGDATWWFTPKARTLTIGSGSYAGALDKALEANEKEVAGLGFSARYGRRSPPR